MPIYEFRCRCGHRFEQLRKIGQQGGVNCPQCGGEAERVMSAFRTGRSSSGPGFASGGGGCSSCSSSSCSPCH